MPARCTHDPRAPRLQLVTPLAPNLPRFIVDAVERCARIYTQPSRFPEITGAAFAPGVRIRRRRSSHLEAVALVAASLARRMDRRTLRVGDQRLDGLCTGVAVREHMKHTGLTFGRAKRALGTLEAACYTHSQQPVVELRRPRMSARCRRGQPVEQRYVGLPAVRVVRPLLLQRLGFTDAKVARARRRATEDWQRRQGRPASAPAIIANRRRTLPPRFYELELRVKARHPDWTYDLVRAEALRLLRPGGA